MSLIFDFGFEFPAERLEKAKVAFLFAARGEKEDFGRLPGPAAIADASRYSEFFDLQESISPLDIGVYSEMCGGADPTRLAIDRAISARERGILPVVIADDRRVTNDFCRDSLVALWGKLGRNEADEQAVFARRSGAVLGLRAATTQSYRLFEKNVKKVTARQLSEDPRLPLEIVGQLAEPLHLSIDLDVLAPEVVQTTRSKEPGGLSWYELTDVLKAIFQRHTVVAVELVGTMPVAPRTTAALIGAQILLKIAGLAAIHSQS